MPNSQQDIRFCTSHDGVRIGYAQTGQGTPLVMSANWMSHLEHQWQNPSWRPWLDALSSRFRVLRYDARGCGLSDWVCDDLSFDAWVGDFEAVVQASGIERFPIVALCQGCAIAIDYAVRHPERVSHLVLIGPFVRGRLVREPKDTQSAMMYCELARMGWATETHEYMQLFATLWLPNASTEVIRSWADLQRVTTTSDNAVRHIQIAQRLDVSEAATRVTCPTLVMHAEHDRVIPVEQGRICAGLIPHSRYVQLDSENHILLQTEPAWRQMLRELDAFLAPEGQPGKRPFANLNQRDVSILELIALGRDNSQIAAELGLSEKTVRNLVSKMYEKLGVENRAQAVVLSREAGYGASTP